MDRQRIVGVMGGGSTSDENLDAAYRLGQLIAEQGWILLNGGRSAGIMDASARGAFEAGGMTVGILPDTNTGNTSPYIRIPVLTGMGSARNTINVLSSHVVVACPGGPGTISEIALALKAARPVILMNFDPGPVFDAWTEKGLLYRVRTPEQAIEKIKTAIFPKG